MEVMEQGTGSQPETHRAHDLVLRTALRGNKRPVRKNTSTSEYCETVTVRPVHLLHWCLLSYR
jgi:hypothetical protein